MAANGAGVVVPERQPEVQVLKLRDDKMKFVLTGTDASVANALRRIMMAQVPTLAIDLVTIHENSSPLPDEFVAHRLGLVPLRWKRPGTDDLPADHFNFPDQCDCDVAPDTVCPKCSVELTLSVANPAATDDSLPVSVTSSQIHVVGAHARELVEIGSFVDVDEKERLSADDGGITLLKLGPGQRIDVTCIARLGVGKVHAKWNPTATVAMRYEPDIRLNYDLLERVSAKDQRDFERRNQPGVFRFDEAAGQLVVLNARKAANIDEIRKIGMQVAKNYGSAENLVSVSFVPDKYIFKVETAGGLRPEQIVSAAMAALTALLDNVVNAASTLPGGSQ